MPNHRARKTSPTPVQFWSAVLICVMTVAIIFGTAYMVTNW